METQRPSKPRIRITRAMMEAGLRAYERAMGWPVLEERADLPVMEATIRSIYTAMEEARRAGIHQTVPPADPPPSPRE